MNTNVKHLIKGLVRPKLKLHLFARVSLRERFPASAKTMIADGSYVPPKNNKKNSTAHTAYVVSSNCPKELAVQFCLETVMLTLFLAKILTVASYTGAALEYGNIVYLLKEHSRELTLTR